MNYQQDPNRPEAKAVAASYDEMRQAGVAATAEERGLFIARVYGHLLAAIGAFALFEVYLFKSGYAESIARTLMGVNWLLVLGGFMVAGWLALLAIVGAVFFGVELGTWFSLLMVGIAGAAVLYDTSKIIRYWPNDRYVAASLELFASVALMFWYILRLLMSRR